MELHIYSENFDITDSIKSHIQEKSNKLSTIIGAAPITIRLKSKENKTFYSSLDTKFEGKLIHLKSEHPNDMYACITDLINKTHFLLNQRNQKNIVTTRKNERKNKVF